jgi:hypothetical protein
MHLILMQNASVCVYLERERERERRSTCITYKRDMSVHYRERDTYEQHVYKHAHMHAVHARIHIRACPYLVSECGIGAERQQLRHRALQPVLTCIMQRRAIFVSAL